MTRSFVVRPPLSIIFESFSSDPSTGTLVWRQRPRWHFYGERSCRSWNARYAGTSALSGYNRYGCGGRITISGQAFWMPRKHVIWALHYREWPKQELGHLNDDWHDDRLENLREQTESQKASFARRSGKSGVKGVKVALNGKFLATITKNGSRKCLGTFRTIEAACKARNEAATVLHGDFARFVVPAEHASGEDPCDEGAK